MKLLNIYIPILTFTFLYSCIDVVELELPNKTPRLIVDGLVINGDGPHKVTLSRTSKYNFKFDSVRRDFETDAVVIISDNENNSDTLSEFFPGVYLTDSLSIIGKIGNSYTLDIYTSGNKHYRSHQETMIAVPKIDSMYYQRDGNDRNGENPKEYKYTVWVDWQDPANEKNYYLRNISYYWAGKWHNNVQWNWVFDDKYIDGFYLDNSILTEGYGESKFFIQLNQYSLTERAHKFWKLVHQQAHQGDSEPTNVRVPLTGNVYNVENPDEHVLGYFQVSAKSVKSIYIAD